MKNDDEECGVLVYEYEDRFEASGDHSHPPRPGADKEVKIKKRVSAIYTLLVIISVVYDSS